MQIPHAALISTLAFAPLILHGQPATPAAPPSTAPVAAAPVTPSSVLQPALVVVESTLNSVKVDRWKRGSVRDEAGDNVNAMLHDLKTNLPPLLADADSSPRSLSKAIPLMKHLDAFYDVLLRVEEGARVSAPGDQVDQLLDALKKLGTARIDLYDNLQQSAAGQEKQVTDLQAQVKVQQAKLQEPKPAPPPAPAPCPTPKPAVKKKRPATPAPAKNTQAQPANNSQTPPAQQKPQ